MEFGPCYMYVFLVAIRCYALLMHGTLESSTFKKLANNRRAGGRHVTATKEKQLDLGLELHAVFSGHMFAVLRFGFTRGI